MDYNVLDLEEYFIQKTISEFPAIMKPILSQINIDIIDGKTKEKVPLDFGSSITSAGNINIIPSKYRGDCYQILVAICYDGDNLDDRLLKFLDHASITCAGINRELFLITTQWNSIVVNKYLGYIDSMRRNGVVVNLIYVSKKGIVLMPV